LKQATSYIITILQKPPTTPVLERGDETTNVIVKIATLVNQNVSLSVSQSPPSIITPSALSATTPQQSTVIFTNPLTSSIPPCKRHLLPQELSPSRNSSASVPRVFQPPKLPPTPSPTVNIKPSTIHQITLYTLHQKTPHQLYNLRPKSRHGISFHHVAQHHLTSNLLFPFNK